MARIFITGSSDGLGFLAAKSLLDKGHQVVLHARNEARKNETLKKLGGAGVIVTGDLADLEQTKELANQVNKLGAFDVVIHNAGIYEAPAQQIFAVNVLAPYILTCLIQKPQRIIYLSSGMHQQGHLKLDSVKNDINRITYSDSKLQVLALCKAVARHWPDVYANAVDPGWVPTKMGGANATDNLQEGYETQVWLAVSGDERANVSGRYFFHQQENRHNPEADDIPSQQKLLASCGELTGVPFGMEAHADKQRMAGRS